MEEYEVHEIYDTYSGEPLSVDNYESYEDAEEAYNELVANGKFARLLLVDEDGMPIDEIKVNY